MKKILVLAVMLCSVWSIFGQALSYRQVASMIKGGNTTTDTLDVTFAERVQAVHVIQCGRASRSVAGNLKTNYTNNTQFTDPQFVEFYSRGQNGEMATRVLNVMLGSANVDQHGLAVTDGQLEASYKNVMFGVIKLIFSGSL